MSAPRKAACIGGGVIGAGWVARLLLAGVDVAVFDPGPEAERIVGEVVANAERAFTRLVSAPLPPQGRLTLCRLDRGGGRGGRVRAGERAGAARAQARRAAGDRRGRGARGRSIGSSTSGLLPSDLQEGMAHPERLVVAHPFNPVYLLPLVEIVAGRATSPEAVARAEALYAGLGMKPVVIRREIEAFVGDRLLEALWREALWLVKDDVASVEEIDDVIRYSLRPALGADGPVPDLPHRRRRGRDAAFSRPVRPGAQMALDQADGRARARRGAGREDRAAVGRADGRRSRSASSSDCATTTSSRSSSASPAAGRDRMGRGRAAARARSAAARLRAGPAPGAGWSRCGSSRAGCRPSGSTTTAI